MIDLLRLLVEEPLSGIVVVLSTATLTAWIELGTIKSAVLLNTHQNVTDAKVNEVIHRIERDLAVLKENSTSTLAVVRDNKDAIKGIQLRELNHENK
jgi:hypothetical protein